MHLRAIVDVIDNRCSHASAQQRYIVEAVVELFASVFAHGGERKQEPVSVFFEHVIDGHVRNDDDTRLLHEFHAKFAELRDHASIPTRHDDMQNHIA